MNEEPTLADVMRELDTIKANVRSACTLVHALADEVAGLSEKIDRAEGQIAHVVELAAPAIEQIASSPIMKMLGGRKS